MVPMRPCILRYTSRTTSSVESGSPTLAATKRLSPASNLSCTSSTVSDMVTPLRRENNAPGERPPGSRLLQDHVGRDAERHRSCHDDTHVQDKDARPYERPHGRPPRAG